MDLTYANIKKVARAFSKEYRKRHAVPDLPDGDLFYPYRKKLFAEFGCVTHEVYAYIHNIKGMKKTSTVETNFKPDPNGPCPGITEDSFCYEHMEWVALLAAYLAEQECTVLGITGNLREQILDVALLTGMLHDIGRHLGWDEKHAVVGAETAQEILKNCTISEEYIAFVVTAVRYHDDPDFYPSQDDLILRIAHGAVFDSDKFRFGLEREDSFWDMKKSKGVTPEDVIHDYKFLYPLENAWKTTLGKDLGEKYWKLGMAIAKHVESTFMEDVL